MNQYFKKSKHLLKVPKQRAAYSDRTSWLLAEMSRLAYERLPSELNRESFVEALVQASRAEDPKAEFARTVELISTADPESGGAVKGALEGIDFRLAEVFDGGGTQGFLAIFKPDRRKIEGFRVLAFRGTEMDNFKDIQTDLTANLVPASGGDGRVHSGFQTAFEVVRDGIEAAIKKHDADLPLYITGHSLGGALATVAGSYLDSDRIAAVYTYGCPRAADDEFYSSMKVPVYRVVNAGDGVPRIPFGYTMTIIYKALWFVPGVGKRISEWLRFHLDGFTHWGHLVFLSPAKAVHKPDGLNFEKRFSPDIFWRVRVVVGRWIGSRFQSLYQDHKIEDYCRKLGEYAEWRNRKDV